MARVIKNSAVSTLKEAKYKARGVDGELIVVDENGCVFVDSDSEMLHKKKEKLFVVKGILPKQTKKESNAIE